jgi:hypothetical protein
VLNGYSQSANDGRPIEVGERFRPDESGVITAVRHFRGAGWAGTRTGHLWSNAGALLATAGTTYVVSYFSSSGAYAATPRAFAGPLDTAPLQVPADAAGNVNVTTTRITVMRP